MRIPKGFNGFMMHLPACKRIDLGQQKPCPMVLRAQFLSHQTPQRAA